MLHAAMPNEPPTPCLNIMALLCPSKSINQMTCHMYELVRSAAAEALLSLWDQKPHRCTCINGHDARHWLYN